MAQQFHNNGAHVGSKTISNRDTYKYAVVNDPFCGKHKKPQTSQYRSRRKLRWAMRNGENLEKFLQQ